MIEKALSHRRDVTYSSMRVKDEKAWVFYFW